LDTKLRKYSHLLLTKIIVFIIMLICFTGVTKNFVDVEIVNDGDFGIVFEDDDYFHSLSYVRESEQVIGDLTRLIGKYKNEEHILKGGTLREEEVRNEEETLFSDFKTYSRSYNPNLSEQENYAKFKEEYKEKLSEARENLINKDVREFHSLLQKLEEYEGPLYYISDGENVYTNTTIKEKQQFKVYPSYLIYEDYKQELYPKEIKANEHVFRITERLDELDPKSHVAYVAFTEEFLNNKIKEWKENKVSTQKSLYWLTTFLIGFILSFVYLVLVIGRKSFTDKEVHLHPIDRLYIDVNLVLTICLIAIWAGHLEAVDFQNLNVIITLSIAAGGFTLVLSLVRHFKNRTLIKHTLIYTMLYTFIKFVGNVYDSGSVGIKTVLLVIGYPLLVAVTFFVFPVTLGIAAWFALKRVKSFNAIKKGVEKIKDGDIQHRIEVDGNGEFAKLAENINSITDGLKNAVTSELKSERLKTELITNVSHDIRTPLTSIITYVDLLKNEQDLSKVEEYVDVLDQKSKRLKQLTDDLFEAAKVSSGNIPVHFDRIDIVSLITQGLGEVNENIEASELDFKLRYPEEKVYMKAEGRLLWRSIENILSNIFKYALKGSRVYIDIEDLGNEISVTFKNISAYELNISADELMERFKRGDESRSSQGSGLGLSIAKSLIDIQNGKFTIQIDGDLFKSTIHMPKENS
jgi:signal transduction histidine kinase